MLFENIHSVTLPAPNGYSLIMLAAILLSAFYWIKTSRDDPQLPLIYFVALGCAFIGAKIAYLLSEGWLHTGEDRWVYWLSGKSITGALIGGFLGVEGIKRFLSYPHMTGDRFAIIVPASIIIGRMGCLTQGCCGGTDGYFLGGLSHWPAVPVEIIFNLMMMGLFIYLRQKKLQTNQHFHLYLIGYGIFRFLHEFLRDTPKVFSGLSGYQIISILILLIGSIAYAHRKTTSS